MHKHNDYPRRRRGATSQGYTLAEFLVAISLFGALAFGMASILRTSLTAFDNTRVEVYTGNDAVLAMQQITNVVREAKTMTVHNGATTTPLDVDTAGTRLRIVMPKMDVKGYYNRLDPDIANPIDFYLSNTTGANNVSGGTWLWQARGNSKRVLRKAVTQLSFTQLDSRSVQISLTTANNAVSGKKQTQLTQRVTFLRNY